MTGPELTTVLQKQNALLMDLAAHSRHPGDPVEYAAADFVICDASNASELQFHLACLKQRGLLNDTGANVISAQGWEHLEQSRNPKSGNRSDFFVAMAFRPHLVTAWEEGIKPGAAAAGYVAKRVDSDHYIDKIDDRIMAGIRSSFGVIVDVTTQNAGAYFEAGFALGLGRPVVWTVHSDDIAKVHLDTRQFNHIVWTDANDLKTQLQTRLIAVFGYGPTALE